MSEPSPFFRVGRSVLISCGLVSLYYILTVPLGYLWGHFVVEGHIASSTFVELALHLASVLPDLIVVGVVGLGVALFIAPPRAGVWAVAIGVLLGVAYFSAYHWYRQPSALERLTQAAEALLFPVFCLGGFVLTTRFRAGGVLAGDGSENAA